MLIYRLSLVVLMLGLGACSTDEEIRRAAYLDADYLTSLQLPPDLLLEDGSSQIELPRPTESAMQRFREGVETDKPAVDEAPKRRIPMPNVEGLRIKHENGLNWIEIDQSSEAVWSVLMAFWENEGVRIFHADERMGLIETDWIEKYQIDEEAGYFDRLFANMDKDMSDRFRMRVERADGHTVVYVAHSGLQRIVEEEASYFAHRPSDIELEIEILKRLMIYVGLQESTAEKLLTEYRPFTSRASKLEPSSIRMTGRFDYVWQSVRIAIDRLGLETIEVDEGQRQIKVAVQSLTKDKFGQEKDEVAESSYLMRWLTGADGDAKADMDRQFWIRMEPVTGAVKVTLYDAEREVAQSALAEQIIKGLLTELN